MLKKAAVLALGLVLCAPAMAKTHHHKYTKVVYVVEPTAMVVAEPVMVRTPVVLDKVVFVKTGYNQYYRYPRTVVYY